MKLLFAATFLCVLGSSVPLLAVAQATGGNKAGVHRLQGGGINYAPAPGVYEVLSVDTYFRSVRIRAADGRTADVHVGDDIYDISSLKEGARIQIDFLAQDDRSAKLRAASIWPVQ